MLVHASVPVAVLAYQLAMLLNNEFQQTTGLSICVVVLYKFQVSIKQLLLVSQRVIIVIYCLLTKTDCIFQRHFRIYIECD